MLMISVRNVNQAFIEGLHVMRAVGSVETSRNGLVRVAPHPVVTAYGSPWERVLFNRVRDANPFFHLAECIWMMGGCNDVRWISQFNSNMGTYSDDGLTFHGAYGHRWREQFGHDQLPEIIRVLRKDPTSRQAVLTMWDPAADLGAKSKDIPCNTHIYFRVRNGYLDMTVCCRSNDVVWGAYGANAVHFSFLQEWLANMIGVAPGMYYQISNNWHVYERHFPWVVNPPSDETEGWYGTKAKWMPLVQEGEDGLQFVTDCYNFVDGYEPRTRFLREVAWPMLNAYLDRRLGKDIDETMEALPPVDWVIAGSEWLARRDASRPTRNYVDQG